MKKLLLSIAMMAMLPLAGNAQQTAEKLGRAPVAVMTKNGVLVSWRSLKGDATTLSFDVYRNGTKINTEPLTSATNILDADGKAADKYTIKASNGEEFATDAWDNMYKTISVQRPPATKDASGALTGRYRPDDISVGDVDADGELEMVIKWFPDNQRDSGKEGKASPTYLTCNKMDGTQLWRINLGHNIRSGNHTMQFLVYDFDGDGKAEIICRTAAGTTDGTGAYVSEAADDATIKAVDNTKTYQNSKGYVTGGEEFLTVFNGATGKAMKTIWYRPNRALNSDGGPGSLSSSWGDSYGGRAERFNAAVAYLDGESKLPSAILQRGYYTQCFVWAVDWDGTSLSTRWLHRGTSKTAWNVIDAEGKEVASGSGKSSYGQGVHGISVGDITGDGCDDICIGSASIDSKGNLLCSTELGHGDAIHMADLIPSRPGLEVMMPHEESPYGYDVHDALTGELIVYVQGSKDNGRGVAADFVPSNPGSEFWSSDDNIIRSCETGSQVLSSKPDTNFRIYWTGDPYDQTFDGRYDSASDKASPRIRIYDSASQSIRTIQEFKSYGAPQTCNTTKATPCLQADILGDWREELIMWQYETDWSSPTVNLMIFSTPEPTDYKVTCLMQDHTYRMGVAWQNSSYNQPPHLGYDLAGALGIDGSTYKTHTTSSAPAASVPDDPNAPQNETLKVADVDKGVVKGTCYTAGENGEITASSSGEYIKIRTNNNGETITFSVNPGYIITAVRFSGYSNNTSTKADRSITMTELRIDDATENILPAPVVFPGGTAGQSPVEGYVKDFSAQHKLQFFFDNSNITTSEIDAAGKNKQLFAKFTFTYIKSSSDAIHTAEMHVPVCPDAIYNLQGQRVNVLVPGQIYISGGKKFVK